MYFEPVRTTIQTDAHSLISDYIYMGYDIVALDSLNATHRPNKTRDPAASQGDK